MYLDLKYTYIAFRINDTQDLASNINVIAFGRYVKKLCCNNSVM